MSAKTMHSVFFAAQPLLKLKLRPVFIHKILVVARNMGLFSLAMEASSLPNMFHVFNFKGINYWLPNASTSTCTSSECSTHDILENCMPSLITT